MGNSRILLVDDDTAILRAVGSFLEAKGFEVEARETLAGAVDAFRTSPPDAAVLDFQLSDGNAVEHLSALQALEPDVPIVILTGHGTIDLAVRAIKEGAEHFLTKPVALAALLVTLERAIENRRNRQRQRVARASSARSALDPFVGTSPAIRALAERARRVLDSDSPILIRGETGSGKGVLARWLHANGPRDEEPLVDLNCAGLSREFLETELFGHGRGAFTGATTAKVGLLESAHRGTVFLDEIGDIDREVQPKLLKVLEEKRFRRLGEVQDRHVDVRLIAATHRDLARLVAEERFRADLYFRINAIPLTFPALRERPEDVPLVAEKVLEILARETGRAFTLSDAALERLRAHAWPGNVRELRNVLDRAVLLGEGPVLGPDDLLFDAAGAAAAAPASATLAGLERRAIEAALEAVQGHVGDAAVRLGVPRSTLYQKLKQHGIARRRS
ncbi:MAG TPA: sigma-54 dependent transcriptional regulator [Anaeromyxobacter sp.]